MGHTAATLPAPARPPARMPKRLLALRSDKRLVELVRAGDVGAFEVLYERHVAGLLGFCRHMLGSQHEAEDAVQQAFLSAHRDMLRGAREIELKPWLYTIARNRCLSMLRARREQPAELGELSTAGLGEQVERRAELRELVADVQRLPERQRSALLLSEFGDLSHAEVAEVIGVPPQAVKALVFRARSALVERREARSADCGDIRAELAVAKGGGFHRGRLRHHLESCPACVAYLDELRRQRRLLGVALPVVPTLALKDSVLGGAGIGAGAGGAAGVAASGGLGAASGAGVAGGAAATGAVTVGGSLLGGTAVKLAVAGAVLVGGAGIATEAARDDGGAQRPPAAVAPAAVDEAPADAGKADRAAGPRGERGGMSVQRRGEGRAIGRERSEKGGRGEARRAGEAKAGRSGARRGKALGRRDGHSVAGGGTKSHGKAVGRGDADPSRGRGQGGGNARAPVARRRAAGKQRAVGRSRERASPEPPAKPTPKAKTPPPPDRAAANRPRFAAPEAR